ncbi:MAG: hypothetical protein RR404_00285 [Bacilli bacterium]
MNFIVTYWVEFLFGILISATTYLIKKTTDYKKTLQSTTKGVQVLLKTKIIEHYNLYKQRNGISIYEKELVNELYKEYHNLGGNGVIESLKEQIDELPLSSKED